MLLFACNAAAQRENIFDNLRSPDTATGATVTFFQDEKIEILMNQKNTPSVALTGTVYRIQVFSSNNQKTAKTDAFAMEKHLKESFPYDIVQVNYSSPFWKVRIGEFGTREAATAFRQQVIDAFPANKNQIYVIADRKVK